MKIFILIRELMQFQPLIQSKSHISSTNRPKIATIKLGDINLMTKFGNLVTLLGDGSLNG